jgi:hypothetical protein
MAKMGRPIVEIDKDTFEAVMGIPFVTYASACEVLKCSQSTLQRWVTKEYKKTFEQIKQEKLEGVKLKLMGKQLEVAMKGNVSMLIFLGKNLLGQSDNVRAEVNADSTLKLLYSLENKKEESEAE